MRRRLAVTVVGVALAATACGSATINASTGPAGTGNGGTATTMDASPMLECGGLPFPVAAMNNPTGAELADEPAAAAFRAFMTANPQALSAGSGGWRKLADTGDHVAFGQLGTDPTVFFGTVQTVDKVDGVWKVGLGAACPAASVYRPGEVAVSWNLAAPAPGPADTTLHAQVLGTGCSDAGSTPATPADPEIDIGPQTVTITWFTAVSPPSGNGARFCSGPAPVIPRVIDLGQPLGNRRVVDGAKYPAQPVG